MADIADPLGLDPNDPRRFTQTGGAPGAGLGAPAAPVTNLAGGGVPSAAKRFMPSSLAARNLNPQLPQAIAAPAEVQDSTYIASRAQLAADVSRKYNDVLKQLGYTDPNTGQFVMGRVETEAQRQQQELERSQGLAVEDVTKQMQNAGTLFSGYRGTQQARAEHPFVQSLADLDINVPLQLSDLYEQAGNIVDDYTLQNNLLLADAARRRADWLASQPAGPTGPQPPGPQPPGPQPPGPQPPGPVAPQGPQTWGGQTRAQTKEAYLRTGLYNDAQAEEMTNRWVAMMGDPDLTPGTPNVPQ